MIYTVTFNPSLDYLVWVEGLSGDQVNRTEKEEIYPGGKGNNVAVVASRLGVKTRALGFKAGFTGDAMEDMLRRHGCDTDFISLEEGLTRINVKVKSEGELEINGQGPDIPEGKRSELYEKLKKLKEGDVLVLSGSIPGTLPGDMYEQIMERLRGLHIETVVDAAGSLLLGVLKYHPFLIKPNHHELGELFDMTVKTCEEAESCGRRLQEMGARNVLISMAGEGAVLLDEKGEIRRMRAPLGKVVNSVGAGDSMTAGFLAGYLTGGSYERALRLGIAAGSATAFTSWLAEREEILALEGRLDSRDGQR